MNSVEMVWNRRHGSSGVCGERWVDERGQAVAFDCYGVADWDSWAYKALAVTERVMVDGKPRQRAKVAVLDVHAAPGGRWSTWVEAPEPLTIGAAKRWCEETARVMLAMSVGAVTR